MGFSRQEHWSMLPYPSPEDLPNLGIEITSLKSPALAGGCFTTEPPGKPPPTSMATNTQCKIPWRREWLLTPVLLSGESHGQRKWVSYSPQGHKESDTSEQLTLVRRVEEQSFHAHSGNTTLLASQCVHQPRAFQTLLFRDFYEKFIF